MNNNQEKQEELLGNPDFKAFVMAEFQRTVNSASLIECAEFAFGNLNDAIEAYLDQ